MSPIAVELEGRLCSGLGEGAAFTRLDWAAREFHRQLGFAPYPGTLNLSLSGEAWRAARTTMRHAKGMAIEPPPGFCAAKCFAVVINERFKGAAVLPEVADYPEEKFEIVAPVELRRELKLRDGDRVWLQLEIK